MCFVITILFSFMAFLPQINNKRDTIFLNIKIIRVIIPLLTILHGYRDSALLQRLGRVTAGNRGYIDLTAKIN